MNFWKVILATVVIFGAGVLTGGLLVNHVDLAAGRAGMAAEKPAAKKPPLFFPRPKILRPDFVQRLDNAVQLEPVQRRKIEKIVAEGQARNRELWQLAAPQFHAVMEDTAHRIRAVLDPEQQRKFIELLKQFHKPHPNPRSQTNAPATSPAH
ncbi:MAG: hypothetical protein KGR98_12225 [Verrucomicrobia bacterium]|nr:hypothetical protein [Verrucomicrobiota bacterium]MDE3098127.1 hypothetical protein [Verrucomicrobiota bacterium]